jgi:phosphoserine phosphatase RsbU/P
VGDVSGHGLDAGLVMMMMQSAMAATVRALPDGTPRELLDVLNEVLFDNIRLRLRTREHVTFTLFRIDPDGRVVFAGAHEDLLIWRARWRQMDRIRTPGVWLGARRGIGNVTIDTAVTLEDGDLMVLYTDGITEARDAAGKQLELDGLIAILEQVIDRTPEEIRDHVVARTRAWMKEQLDDITIVVVRRTG